MSGPPGRYPEVVVGTANPGALIEIRAILGDLPLALRSLGAFPEVLLPEEGDDYAANALGRARAAARDSGRAAIADATGLEVDALAGRPAPGSGRSGGPASDDADRVRLLLEALQGVEGAARSARLVCVAAVATPAGATATARGECAGRILEAPRGRGLGYDPVFAPGEAKRSLAELAPAVRHGLSHRAIAFRALRGALEEHVLGGC